MLEVEALEAGYGRRAVSRLPALRLESGAAALLLGGSGSGKTTLMLAIAGLATRFGGHARIDGADLADLSGRGRDRARARMIGFVFQDIHLVAGLTALENVLLAPYAAGLAQDRGRAKSLLRSLGLEAHAGRRAEQMSRGQAQRIAIARALMLKPRLLLADEPTASLDDESAETVAGLLLAAAAEANAPLLIATHDSRLKSRIAHQVRAEAVA